MFELSTLPALNLIQIIYFFISARLALRIQLLLRRFEGVLLYKQQIHHLGFLLGEDFKGEVLKRF